MLKKCKKMKEARVYLTNDIGYLRFIENLCKVKNVNLTNEVNEQENE